MNRLRKLAYESSTYREFESETLRWLWWYEIPKDWTKRHLLEFYFKNRGA